MLRSVHLTCSNGIHTLFPLNTTTTLRWSAITAARKENDLIALSMLGKKNTPSNPAMS